MKPLAVLQMNKENKQQPLDVDVIILGKGKENCNKQQTEVKSNNNTLYFRNLQRQQQKQRFVQQQKQKKLKEQLQELKTKPEICNTSSKMVSPRQVPVHEYLYNIKHNKSKCTIEEKPHQIQINKNSNLLICKRLASKVLEYMGNWNSMIHKEKIFQYIGLEKELKQILDVCEELNALNIFVFVLAIFGIKLDQQILRLVISKQQFSKNSQNVIQIDEELLHLIRKKFIYISVERLSRKEKSNKNKDQHQQKGKQKIQKRRASSNFFERAKLKEKKQIIRKKNLSELIETQRTAQCTFRPKINQSNRTNMIKPKKMITLYDTARFRQNKIDKSTQQIEFEKNKNQCIFTPRTKRLNKKIIEKGQFKSEKLKQIQKLEKLCNKYQQRERQKMYEMELIMKNGQKEIFYFDTKDPVKIAQQLSKLYGQNSQSDLDKTSKQKLFRVLEQKMVCST